MKKAIYPGSFDPITFGHQDMIERSAAIVDELIVGVLNNSEKNSLFSVNERVSMLKELTKDIPNVTVDSFDGLLVALGPVAYIIRFLDLFVSMEMVSRCLLIILVIYNIKFGWSILMWVIRKIPGVS